MIVDPEIERYLESLLPERLPVLKEMEALAAERRIPIVGPVVGRILAQLAQISGAKRIFELGSAIGYSTIWLALAAGDSGEVHYSDGSRENARLAQAFFERAGVSGRIHIHVGDALEALSATEGDFDLIFNDVDKEGYPAVLEQAPARLRRQGLLITDNVLWHGRVLDPQDEASRAVVEFNRKLFSMSDFWTCILPVRDGISVALKLR